MIIKSFYDDVLRDYEKNLSIFFDAATGAVFEPGREDGTPKFLFTEVTGYALLDDLTLFSLTGNPHYVDKARKSADWIMRHAQDPTGGVLTRYYFERDTDPALADKSFAGRRIFTFDVAICLRGMVALYRYTGDEALLHSAVRMGDYLLECTVSPEGEVVAIYDAAAGRPVPADRNKWSRCFGAFHSKAGESLIDLYAVTGQEKYARGARAICRKVIEFQSPKGNFETSSGRTELHPHCYATEGLLHVGRMSGEEEFIEAARRATEWALGHCHDGEIAQVIDSASDAPRARFRTDALAQVLALGADLVQMGRIDADMLSLLDQLAAKVLSMKKNGDGYFQYGFYEREFKGKIEADTHSYWTNMFCMRGLIKYYTATLLQDAYVAILAGGIGSRVWPISCENRPKPVSYSLLGDRSLLQETIRRFTHDFFIMPERIFILCSANALGQVSEQAGQEGVPPGNCVIEKEPKGTIPAVGLALDGLPLEGDRGNRLVVISMGDNLIAPHERFQDAVRAALITAREHNCLVSIGKPADKDAPVDVRFGHHLYTSQVASYRTYEVPRFIEKPGSAHFETIRTAPGRLAWESGAVIFREEYYRELVPGKPESGNLAEHLLSRAGAWDQPGQVRLATALMDPAIRFEDFGVPGISVKRFYQGHERFDRGNGNICLGTPEKVRLLSCGDNLVISDELPIEIYGLKDHLVIDNAITNTAVVMPLTEVEHLPNLYRLFSGSRRYEPFIAGGPKALMADPTMFVEKSPDTHASSDFGLVFAYNIKEKLSISRSKDGLHIINETFPYLDRKDFEVLVRKEGADARLVQHLVDVGALAKSLIGGSIVLSSVAADLLNRLCLYHAIGGCLTEEGERKEGEIIRKFREFSKLDRRFLDSRIIYEIMGLHGQVPSSDDSLVDLLSDNVNSAVEFLRSGSMDNADLRDILVALMQIQDNPHSFAALKKNLERSGLGALEDEIAEVFACFKMAKNIAVGRWLWKRRRQRVNSGARNVFLQFDRGDLEEFPFILSFTINWLKSAGIEPGIYVDRINQLLIEEDSAFMSMLERLEGGASRPASDRLYLELLRSHPRIGTADLSGMLDEAADYLEANPDQAYQYTQLLELPMLLEGVAANCSTLSADGARHARELVVDFYHKHWKRIRPHISPELIARLLA
ncbi:MAG: sugar phosphate nucleotidyltransferase [Gammaproteobacteria bacterium]